MRTMRTLTRSLHPAITAIQPMKNPDHSDDRRRDLGDEDEDTPDGREVARALYGGGEEREPTDREDGTTNQ